MNGRFTTAVSFYGTKDKTLANFMHSVQEIVQHELGAKFLPYKIEHIHGTLIALDTAIDPGTGLLVHNHYRNVTHTEIPVNPSRMLDIIRSYMENPCRIRIGGYRPSTAVSFASRGIHPYDRMFSSQKQTFVLLGWPLTTIKYGLTHRPLDDLRRAMNEAGIMHLYHDSMTDIDNDLHFVIGHHDDASPEGVWAAVQMVKDYLTDHPIEFNLGIDQISIIVSDSATLANAKFIGKIPADQAEIIGLFNAIRSGGRI